MKTHDTPICFWSIINLILVTSVVTFLIPGTLMAVEWSSPLALNTEADYASVDVDFAGLWHSAYLTVSFTSTEYPISGWWYLNYNNGNPASDMILDQAAFTQDAVSYTFSHTHVCVVPNTPHLHVSYQENIGVPGEDWTSRSLKYVHRDDYYDGAWSGPQTIASMSGAHHLGYPGRDAKFAALAVDDFGDWHASYIDCVITETTHTDYLMYKSNSSGPVVIRSISHGVGDPYTAINSPDVSVDHLGHIDVTYVIESSGQRTLEHRHYDGLSWWDAEILCQLPATGYEPSYSQAFDYYGDWHVVYTEGTDIMYVNSEYGPVMIATPGEQPIISMNPARTGLYVCYAAEGHTTTLIHKCIDDNDVDGDNIGNLCDPCVFDALNDQDADGLCADEDNCPAIANPEQLDADEDEIGDECDECTDTDNDTFGDPDYPVNTCPEDNCPMIANEDQLDSDGDGVGDACTFWQAISGGTGVVADLGSYMTLTFDEVTVGGDVELELTSSGPESSEFQLVPSVPPIYWNVSTTALFDGNIEICVSWDESWVDPEEEAGLRLVHFDGAEWIDITSSLDVEENVLCGTTATLSPFALASSPYTCGDPDGSGGVDIDDVVFLINYIFAGGSAPDPIESGDADCSGAPDIDDVVYLIAYIFAGGNAPCDPNGDAVPDC